MCSQNSDKISDELPMPLSMNPKRRCSKCLVYKPTEGGRLRKIVNSKRTAWCCSDCIKEENEQGKN